MICNPGSRVVNNYLISSDPGTILIDAGYDRSFPRFLKMPGKNGVEPKTIRCVFLTHAHDDHAGFLNAAMNGFPGRRGTIIRIENLRSISSPGMRSCKKRPPCSDPDTGGRSKPRIFGNTGTASGGSGCTR